MTKDIDPRLTLEVQRRAESDDNVQALVTLRSGDGGRALAPEETKKSVDAVVGRAVTEQTNKPKVVVMKHMQSFFIDAPATVVAKVLSDDEVSSASLNM